MSFTFLLIKNVSIFINSQDLNKILKNCEHPFVITAEYEVCGIFLKDFKFF